MRQNKLWELTENKIELKHNFKFTELVEDVKKATSMTRTESVPLNNSTKITGFNNFWYVESWENLTWTVYTFQSDEKV